MTENKIKKKSHHRGATPFNWTKKLEDEICLVVATNSIGLEELCRTRAHWPDSNLIYEHRIKSKVFGDNFAKAKANQVDVHIEKTMQIANDKSEDYVESEHGRVGNSTAVNRARLQIDTLKFYISKLAPKVYGDRMQVTQASMSLENIDFDSMNEDQINSFIDKIPSELEERIVKRFVERSKKLNK